MRLFFALAAVLSMPVCIGDTKNAYQQSPGPSVPCFLEIDEAVEKWYFHRFGTKLNCRTHVIPLHKALQGHPEAGKLFEGMINKILKGEDFGFKSTTHERNLYVGKVDGEKVLVCHQVDDFAVASRNIETAKKFISMVDSHVTTSFKGMGIETESGMFVRYNGLDVHQTREYCKLNCQTYIDRILQTHGWTSPSPGESDRHDAVPMTAEVSQQLQLLEGPAEGTAAHKALEKEVGYSYRQVLGEIVYAYVLCRPDIGYAVTFLS
jgi:hypothetical protein